MDKSTDRRILRTKKSLRDGLAKLMKTKSISHITVKELVWEAEINRSTFYLHYTDISDLLDEIEKDMLEEIERAIFKHPIEVNSQNTFYFIEDILKVLEANRELGCALIGEYGDIGFIHKIQHVIEENSRNILMEFFPESREDLKYFYSYCLNGCFGMVKTWLLEGEDKSPDFIAGRMYQMVVGSIRAFHQENDMKN